MRVQVLKVHLKFPSQPLLSLVTLCVSAHLARYGSEFSCFIFELLVSNTTCEDLVYKGNEIKSKDTEAILITSANLQLVLVSYRVCMITKGSNFDLGKSSNLMLASFTKSP
jgi:hypothetical protein